MEKKAIIISYTLCKPYRNHFRSPKDFGSASDKVWGHFAMLGLKRTDRPTLMKMGILDGVCLFAPTS
jgi:hypothetical protein